jgi:glyoxylase-like metal-dependent hydrolase (beta-lactamase superfamily II)
MTRVARVLADNPGPYTLEGTNTWVVGESPAIVIDPGPSDERHMEIVLEKAGPIGAVLITHRHPDHAPGAQALAAASGAPVLALEPRHGEERLAAGQAIAAGGIVLRAVRTPGHSPDHVIFHDVVASALFTGDAVLGRGTSVIDPPEGDMADYVRSLVAMRALAPRVLYPGHGPVVETGVQKLDEYLAHRQMRERQVLECLAVATHARSPDELAAEIYSDYPDELRAAAARTLLAHLLKLEAEGGVVRAHEDDDRFVIRHADGPSN